MAAQCQVYPGDQTFTTRLRNVEWGHEGHNPFSIRNVHVPRMNPEAVTYPAGTRMNWVTWAPIMPEDDNQHDPDYGNGPGKNFFAGFLTFFGHISISRKSSNRT